MHRVVLIGLSMSFVIGEVFEMGDGRLRGGGLHHQHFMDVIACCEYSTVQSDMMSVWGEREY